MPAGRSGWFSSDFRPGDSEARRQFATSPCPPVSAPTGRLVSAALRRTLGPVASVAAMGIEQKTASEDRAFIRLLGRLLGEVIREQHGQTAYALVEDIRRQSVGDYRAGQGEMSLDRLLVGLSQPDMLLLIRAFSIFSQLANTADDHILRRQIKALGIGPGAAAGTCPPASAPGGCAAFLKDALFVPVITAHPTEVRRKSILDRETEIGELAGAARARQRPDRRTGGDRRPAQARDPHPVADPHAARHPHPGERRDRQQSVGLLAAPS